MGILSFLFSLSRPAARGVVRATVKGPKRTFATYPKRANPFSKRSLGNTSRYRRF
jgi:hypothetical protein